MFYAKMMALISGLLTSISYDILKYTNKSNAPVCAYKRYVSTIFHMCTWYDEDITSDSKVWKSLGAVRHYHNSTSKRCSAVGVGEITQAQMAVTQFAFMGYAVVRCENIGIYNPIEEDMEGFVHFWRIIGYIMGIEERFNICRESMSETKGICEEMIQELAKPGVIRRDPAYSDMAEALIDGMSAMAPTLDLQVATKLIVEMLHNKKDDTIELNLKQRMMYYFTLTSLYLMRFRWVRITQNYHLRFILYVTKTYPLLAYYRFGKANTYVPVAM